MATTARPTHLALPDELLLLALDDTTGRRARATELEPGLAGAVLLDLALRRRIDVVEDGVVVIDPSPTGDAVLDALLARITAGRRRRSAKHWVSAGQKSLRAAVTDRLVASGALRREERRVLGLRFTRHLAGDPAPGAAVRARLVAASGRSGSPTTAPRRWRRWCT